MAAGEGFEPSHTESESAVLPLHKPATSIRRSEQILLYRKVVFCQAFLKNITYGNISGETSFKKCTASVGTTDALVQATCNFIVVKVKVGTESEVTGSQANITSHSLDKNSAEKVTVTIEYLPTENQADGDFTVDFGDITLGYSTID